ncbi:serine threonine-protein kinase, partial [Colletotrichum incanum]
LGSSNYATMEAKSLFTIHSQDTFLRDPHNSPYIIDKEDMVYATDPWATSHDGSASITRDGTPAPNFKPPAFLRINTEDWPRDAHLGFTFGSDAKECDVLLDKNNDNGISGIQFSFRFNPADPGTFLFRNRSKHGTRVVLHDKAEVVKSMRSVPAGTELRIFLGQEMEIHIRVPSHATHWDTFRNNWQKMVTRYADLPPDIQHLGLGSLLRTSRASSTTSRYHRGGMVGNGGSGIVSRGMHQCNGKVYAIKKYDCGGEGEHEANILQRLSHEHIVKFVEFLPNEPALVTEFVGPNLESVVIEHPLRPIELRKVLGQLLEALDHIHSRGIIHRDVKPANVLLKQRKPIHVRLCDFGIATTAETHGLHRQFTPTYAAPEVLAQQVVKITNGVDLWSLGIMALEFSHGLPPCQDKMSSAWLLALNKHLNNCPTTYLVKVIRKWLKEKPNSRPTAWFCLRRVAYFTMSLELLFDGGVEVNVPEEELQVSDSDDSVPDTASFEWPTSTCVMTYTQSEEHRGPEGDEEKKTDPYNFSEPRSRHQAEEGPNVHTLFPSSTAKRLSGYGLPPSRSLTAIKLEEGSFFDMQQVPQHAASSARLRPCDARCSESCANHGKHKRRNIGEPSRRSKRIAGQQPS